VLLVQPLEESVESGIGQDASHGVESVPQFVVAPGFVDEVLARMTRRHDLGSTLAARDHVVAAGWNAPLAEHTLRFFIFDFRV